MYWVSYVPQYSHPQSGDKRLWVICASHTVDGHQVLEALPCCLSNIILINKQTNICGPSRMEKEASFRWLLSCSYWPFQFVCISSLHPHFLPVPLILSLAVCCKDSALIAVWESIRHLVRILTLCLHKIKWYYIYNSLESRQRDIKACQILHNRNTGRWRA